MSSCEPVYSKHHDQNSKESGDEIIDRLEPDAEAQETIGDADGRAFSRQLP